MNRRIVRRFAPRLQYRENADQARRHEHYQPSTTARKAPP